MYDPFAAALLAIEAQNVVQLRLAKFAWGGAEAQTEAQTMVNEKLSALVEASGTLLMGGSLSTVVARYREHVAANSRRLASV